MADFNAMQEALVACDQDKLTALVNGAVGEGVAASEILNKGLIAGMDIVGEKMESGDMFIPEVLMAAQTMAACLEIIKPLLGDDESSAAATVVIGTVKGDLHDIGKNLVAMMMESAGMKVVNLGVDIDPEQFVAQIKDNNASIVCLSALLTTTMVMMKETIDAISEAGLREQVKIMIGGAPVTQAYADEIGADGFAPDAGSAAKLAKKLAA
ncbi:corrinoid protein [Desulforhopalus singaporensis]|uniref:Methylmalonyl-CoA mutase C-terminal domain-containing protein/methyltransferase cognate corrinoid proteins n=1 Tax=Desulforhopalus singaporensis TaxID=91360 RepID=A0A1H0KCR1_9BACT|nr:corrinoid protein [Desulforhopalus singaporensis]SDO53748.1 methylmalonyl-CoA mutase C-terminal domain-containing protein/methyltransferase cognate corrinoid proteins [Desulforhopalus singaporensis]